MRETESDDAKREVPYTPGWRLVGLGLGLLCLVGLLSVMVMGCL